MMIFKQITSHKKHYELNNKGFSLVELVICVAILGIAVIPLMKAFSLAADTNGKAQKMQNATSLAESLMEEAKSSGIDNLIRHYDGIEPDDSSIPTIDDGDWTAATTESLRAGAASLAAGGYVSAAKKGAVVKGVTASGAYPYYVWYIPDITVTQGQTYNATVTISSAPYSMGSSTLTSTSANVTGANIVKLPKIEEMDSLTQAVLTSKEFTKYDTAALEYFVQKMADISSANPTLTKKEIKITKSNAVGINDAIRIVCDVSYYNSLNTDVFTRNLYTGTYTQQSEINDDDGSTTMLPLNSNIYLFYKKSASVAAEEIIVNDSSTIGDHKVFLIMQDGVTNIAGTTIDYSLGTVTKDASNNDVFTATNTISFDATGYGSLDEDGVISSGTEGSSNYMELITNLGKNASEAGHIYKTEASMRVYDITVEITKTGEDKPYATLKSTVDAK